MQQFVGILIASLFWVQLSVANPIPAYHGSTFRDNFPTQGLVSLHTFDQFDCSVNSLNSEFRDHIGGDTNGLGTVTGVAGQCLGGADRTEPGVPKAAVPVSSALSDGYLDYFIGTQDSLTGSLAIRGIFAEEAYRRRGFDLFSFVEVTGTVEEAKVTLGTNGNEFELIYGNEFVTFGGAISSAYEAANAAGLGPTEVLIGLTFNIVGETREYVVHFWSATTSASVIVTLEPQIADELVSVFTSLKTVNANLRIGQIGSSSSQMDEVYTFSSYSRVLSNAEFESMWNAGRPQVLPMLNEVQLVNVDGEEDVAMTIDLAAALQQQQGVITAGTTGDFAFELLSVDSGTLTNTSTATTLQYLGAENDNTGATCDTPITAQVLLKHKDCVVDECRTFVGTANQNKVNLEVCLTPVNDKPSNVEPTVVDVQYPTATTFDVTWEDPDSSTFTLTPSGEINGELGTTCENAKAALDPVEVTGKTQEFCYKPNAITIDSGNKVIATQTLTIQVSDEGALTESKAVTLRLLNPLEMCPQFKNGTDAPCEYRGLEDEKIKIVLQGKDNSGESKDGGYDFTLTQLPSVGKFVDESDNELTSNIVVGTLVAETSVISAEVFYVPPPNFFNRGDESGLVTENPNGEYLGDLVTFSYTMTAADVSTYTQDATVVVSNVRDPVSNFDGPEKMVIYRNRFVNFTGISVEDPDKGLEETEFTLTGTSTSFKFAENFPAELLTRFSECLDPEKPLACQEASFRTYTTHFGAVMEYMTVRSDVSILGSDARVTVYSNLDGTSYDLKKDISISVGEDDIDPNTSSLGNTVETILYSVAGGLVFLGLVSTYVAYRGLHKTKKSRRRGSSDSDSDNDVERAASPRSKKKAKGKSDAPRTLTPSVIDDSIFDWEKHIDKKTGDVYYFNPKTGQSQWDPPMATRKK